MRLRYCSLRPRGPQALTTSSWPLGWQSTRIDVGSTSGDSDGLAGKIGDLGHSQPESAGSPIPFHSTASNQRHGFEPSNAKGEAPGRRWTSTTSRMARTTSARSALVRPLSVPSSPAFSRLTISSPNSQHSVRVTLPDGAAIAACAFRDWRKRASGAGHPADARCRRRAPSG